MDLRQRWVLLRGDHLVKNSFFLFASSGAMGGFGFFFWIVNAHLFSVTEVGVATTLITATVLISYAAQLGFNSSLVRFLPASTDPDSEASTGLALVFLAALVLGAVYIAIVPTVVPQLASIRRSIPYSVGFVLFTALSAVNLVTDSIFVARRAAFFNFVIDGVAQSIVKLMLPVALVSMGAFGIFAASGFAASVAVVASIVVLSARLGYRLRPTVSVEVVRRVFRYAGGNYLANLLNLLPILLLPVIVVHVRGAADGGYYYIAYQIANLLFALAFAVSSSLFAEGSHEGTSLAHVARRAARLEAITMIPLSLALIVVSHPLLSLFGARYAGNGRGLLVVLALSAPVVAFCDWAVALLRLSGQLRALVLTNAIYAVTMCGLASIWAHRGLAWVGAAWLVGNLVCGSLAALALLVRTRGEGTDAPGMVPA